MNIHEYQAKELFARNGIPVPKGAAVQSSAEFDAALDAFPDGGIVVKAQIHAGGRGKGHFTDGYQGGVKVLTSKDEARQAASRMLGNTLITKQTGPSGRKVQTVYFTEVSSIEKEYYLAILLDRSTAHVVIIASTEGGMDIETVAEETPEKITRVFIDPVHGFKPYHARAVAYSLGFAGDQVKQASSIISALYRLFWESDASLIEINPLTVSKDGRIEALDAKMSVDDNALFRHPDLMAMRDLNEEDPREVEASKHSLNYIALDGNIACLVNGAGLAMATMDIIKHFGGSPANFLDVGGSATEEQVKQAFKIILSDSRVRGILVNIFGGIMKCDIIAGGIIAAATAVDISVPLVVRLEGTNVEAGKKLLEESGLAIHSADSLSEAAEKIVELSGRTEI